MGAYTVVYNFFGILKNKVTFSLLFFQETRTRVIFYRSNNEISLIE